MTAKKFVLELDEDDAELVSGALETSYTWTLDALAACAGKGFGERPRRAPDDGAAAKNRAQLDRIERVLAALDRPLNGTRRPQVEAYYEREAAIGRAKFAGI